MDKNKQQTINKGLYLVSTPIGNMEDITFRALNVLKKSDVILCEDTRRSSKLLYYYDIKNKLLPYHKFNEKKVSDKVINLLKDNKIVSMICDAGTPTISDPGMILVNRCVSENLNIYPIPGPSAVTSAISISGFNEKYLFYGFLDKKEKELKKTFNNLYNLDYSLIFFIPASKINFYISRFKEHFHDRKIMIAKEMTKIHEEAIRGKIESIESFSSNFKGELTVVLSGKMKDKNIKKEISESVKIEIKKMLKKYSHKDVVEFFSKKENLPKKIIYNFCLKLIK
ncbi:MAG: 16S rRNA (cytidine(1402)-2'-O)-methyltransferase [Pelagibacteraceae bacterium]|nr:16S rRNA (cytidine(1402)-2'-O)-methyltransferase [Pelagibacteraceae bacterium]